HRPAQPGPHRARCPRRGDPMTAIARARGLAAKIDAATPAHRDRTVDALRALAIAGVILGHWLVTALVLGSGRAGHGLHDQSPLAAMPYLTPLSWLFQTLAVFFLVGGYAAAPSYRGGDPAPPRPRPGRPSPPGAPPPPRLGAPAAGVCPRRLPRPPLPPPRSPG